MKVCTNTNEKFELKSDWLKVGYVLAGCVTRPATVPFFVYNNEVYLFCEIWLTEDGGFYHSYFTEFNTSMNPKPSPTWQDTDGKHSFEYTDGVLFLESSPGNNKVRVYERV